jgi:hypothetical protein
LTTSNKTRRKVVQPDYLSVRFRILIEGRKMSVEPKSTLKREKLKRKICKRRRKFRKSWSRASRMCLSCMKESEISQPNRRKLVPLDSAKSRRTSNSRSG